MNDLENRLTAALTERADGLAHSPEAWEHNQARLGGDRVRTPGPYRKFRAPLLIAAAVLAITATVAVVGIAQRPEPVAPPVVDTSDCGFGHHLPNSYGSASTAAASGALIAISATADGRACFFNGVAWHAGIRLGDGSPLLTDGTAATPGHTWWWGVLSAEAAKLVFVNSAGAVLPEDNRLDLETSGGGKATLTSVARELTGSGTVRVMSRDGKILTELPYDMTRTPTDVGPTILAAPTPAAQPEQPLGGVGQSLTCPVGAATATVSQKVSDGTSITMALHQGSVAGESALCLVASADSTSRAVPVGVIPELELPGGPLALVVSPTGTPLLWGAVGPKVGRVDIMEGTKVTRFVATAALAGRTDVLMSSVGSYHTFALPAPTAKVGYQITTYDGQGHKLYGSGFGG
ncbi:hypothetical protein ABIB25_004327 [Nakamurella sp. UYEF19]|uniref:hypothetical protein n=1 Tax=Nakamurella sp. UYEF19 TaxID=1756392 RepID=UPI00339B9BB6